MHETLGTSADRYTLRSPLRPRPPRSLEDTARSIQATNTVARFPLQFRFRYSLYPWHHQYLCRPAFSLSPRQLPRSRGIECSLHLGYPSYSDPANQERCGRVIRSVADFYINRFIPPSISKNPLHPLIQHDQINPTITTRTSTTVFSVLSWKTRNNI